MDSRAQQGTLLPHILITLASVLVAGSFIASDHLAGHLHPILLTLLRFVIAVALLAPFILLRSNIRAELKRTFPRAALLSFFYAAFFVGMFESLSLTSTLNTATIYTLVPLITALLAALFLHERIGVYRLFVYLLGALGTLWVVFEGQLQAMLQLQFNTGDIVFLGASLSMCCYSVGMKYFYRDDDLWVFVWCGLVGALMWLLLALLLFGVPLEWKSLNVVDWSHLLYLAVGTTILTAYLYQRGTVALGPSRVTAYVYLNPLIVCILMFGLDGERIEALVLPGILISAFATFMLVRQDVGQTGTG